MPDPQTLPALVRAKYPGVYDDLSDQELDAKVRAKFPGVYDDLPKPTQSAAPSSLKAPGSGLGQMASALKDVGVGAVKGAAHTALDAAQLIQYAPGFQQATTGIGNAIGGAVARGLYGRQAITPPVSGQHAIDEARQATAYNGNAAQMVGGALETGAELLAPGINAAKAIPTTARAGVLFNEVSTQAGKIPVETKAINEAIMRVKDEIESGAGSMPTVVTKLINRLDQPIQNAGPLVYDESRKFGSNLSALTVRDIQSLNKTGQAAVANLAATVARANADAAYAVGKGAEYAKAMNMYAQAKRLQTAVKKAIPIAAGAIGAKYLYDKGKALLGE